MLHRSMNRSSNPEETAGAPRCAWGAPVTIYLPHVLGIQSQTRDNSLLKLYNGKAVVWRGAPRAVRSSRSQSASLPLYNVRFVQDVLSFMGTRVTEQIESAMGKG